MKKILLFLATILMIESMNAQRCAILDFRANVGISQSDVDGISSMFITYFRPEGYVMVERTQVNKIIEEQGFQRSKMTESEMVRVGQILNVSHIVVGDVNITFGQYQVDVRVVDVEKGIIVATEGATFTTSSYRSSMQDLAQKLASKIAIKEIKTISSGCSIYSREKDYEFLCANMNDPNVVSLPTGLQYKVIKMGTGKKPYDYSKVTINYIGRLADGSYFDSGKNISFRLTQVIRGWVEGLQLMPEGSQFILYIPSYLGYGATGAGGVIPGGATVIFDIELIAVE